MARVEEKNERVVLKVLDRDDVGIVGNGRLSGSVHVGNPDISECSIR